MAKPSDKQVSEAIDFLEQQLAHLRQMHESNIRDNTAWYRLMLRDLGAIRDTVETVGKAWAITAVINGHLTKTAAGEVFGVHPNTIDRWVKTAVKSLRDRYGDSGEQRAKLEIIFPDPVTGKIDTATSSRIFTELSAEDRVSRNRTRLPKAKDDDTDI